jgi:tRNA pseudouridine55 synthase
VSPRSTTGVLLLDKPVGPTSHDAVAAVRRALGVRQVGHTGTLDPFASGLLLLCVGEATRLAEYFAPLPKRYLATLRLGEATDTDDRTGSVVAVSDGWRAIPREAIEAAFATQVGTLLQLPPAYSAKKVGGERLYRAARRGEVVERSPSAVTVHAIRVLSVRLPDVEFEVECGPGTYVRAIARDAGAALGVGAHLTRLRRTAVGPHVVDAAVTMDRLAEPDAVAAAMLSPASAVSHLPAVPVDAAGEAELRHGRPVPAHGATGAGPVALVSPAGTLLAIGAVDGERVRPRKVFAGAA